MLLIVLVTIFVGFPLLVSSDADTSTSVTAIPNNKSTDTANKVGNSPAGATITLMMYTGDEE